MLMPQSTQVQTAGNAGQSNPNYIMDHLGKGLGSLIDLAVWKGLSQYNDGDLPMTYDPFSGVGLGKTNTMGSAGVTSLWKATDMFWLGGGAAIILGIWLIKKK